MLKEVLTVSALTKYIKLKFDKDKYMRDIPLRAEIADINLRRGNYYLRLKDEHAIISGVIFAQYDTDVIKKLEKGSEVDVVGDISVYEKTGSYQIYIRSVELAGLGNIYQAFENLKKKLQDGGYFDAIHKKLVPKFPKKIAIVTAPHSAALHDMLITTKKRYPLVELALFYTSVQGEKAKTEILEQLKLADNSGADVVVLARGGGSYEDLQAFNDENIAMQIFNMQTPIVTGVGHEVDITIVDLVADMRAATPTAAIEYVTPDKVELLNLIENYRMSFQRQFMRLVQKQRKEITHQMQRLSSKSPEVLLKNEKLQLLQAYKRIQSPYLYAQIIQKQKRKLKEQQEKIVEIMASRLVANKELLNQKKAMLEAISPFETLLRGYAIAQKDERVLTTISQVKTKDTINVLVQDGNIICEVLNTGRKYIFNE